MEEKLLKIIDYYEVNRQVPVWIEEMSELTKELCKFQRTGVFNDNIKTEITDVQICLDQIKLVLNYLEEEQKKEYEFKVDRQLNRIKEDK